MKIILSLFFVLLHSVLSYAYNQFSFVKYQVENGLSHNTVWYTIQDHQGFMWFGTSDGLNRFDGKNFKIFRHIPKDSTSLGNNIVRTIFEDERQNLWVGTNPNPIRSHQYGKMSNHTGIRPVHCKRQQTC